MFFVCIIIICGDIFLRGNMDLIALDEVDSTNLYAKRELDYLSDKTVISAKRQTCGRGRLGRKWIDLGEGNLFVTIVLKPSEVFDEKYSNLTQYMSVCICKTLEFFGLKPEIKWPNDVQISGKKIAGILCETVVQGTVFKGLILGFGINISASQTGVLQITDKDVTSLSIELKSDCPSGASFLDKLLSIFWKDYNNFLNEGFMFIKKDYLKRACFLNKKIKVSLPDRILSGTAFSVDNSGALKLACEDENIVLSIGDIL